MKNNKKNFLIIIISTLCICVLILLLFLINIDLRLDKLEEKINSTNYDNAIIENSYNKINGIYQATYYNNYNKQIIETIKLYDNEKCKYDYAAADYAGKNEKECTWTSNQKEITIDLGNGNIKTAELLDTGILFMDNTQFRKIG